MAARGGRPCRAAQQADGGLSLRRMRRKEKKKVVSGWRLCPLDTPATTTLAFQNGIMLRLFPTLLAITDRASRHSNSETALCDTPPTSESVGDNRVWSPFRLP
jgi:hypothetical protein